MFLKSAFSLGFLPAIVAAIAIGTSNAQDVAVAEKPAKEQSSSADGKVAKKASEYVRVRNNAAGRPAALETSIVRYTGVDGSTHEDVEVDLIGVVHIGEKEYYEELQKRLRTYDVVLYELVAPDGTRIRPEDLKDSRSPLASMQMGMREMLNLEYQLEHIDYMAKNFRHADMSPEEFMEDLEKRGDSLLKMGLRAMGAGLANSAAGGGDAGVLMALFAGKDRPKKLKQSMAKQLADVETMTIGLDDANGENTIIRSRNIKAFNVLREELAAGKKKIAVFYGAGHLPDMAERLGSEFSMERASAPEWFQAWDLQSN